MTTKNFTAAMPRGESLRVTVHGGPDVPDLDAEAEHVAECIAALKDARWHFDRIKGATNRVSVSFHLPRIEVAMDRERKALAHIHEREQHRISRYRAEALGFVMKSALGIPAGIHATRLAMIDGEEHAAQQQRERDEQRARERAIFDAATLAVEQRPQRKPREQRSEGERHRGHVAKVSDASLIAEVRSKRHRSISDLARAVGLASPTTWNRVNALVKAGKLGADEVPRGTGGRPKNAD